MNIFKKFITANLIMWAMMGKHPLTMILFGLYYPILIAFAMDGLNLAEKMLMQSDKIITETGELNGTTER